MNGEELDENWDKLVLGAIGELIDPDNEVTGVRVIHKVRWLESSGTVSAGSIETLTRLPHSVYECAQNKRDKKDPGNSYRYEIWLRGLDRAKADDIRNRIVEVINSDTGSSRAAWTPIDFVYKKH